MPEEALTPFTACDTYRYFVGQALLIGRHKSRIRLRNDLYCVEWGVKLYSLTHSQK